MGTREGRLAPLGLFPGKPTTRLYDAVIETLRDRHYCRRTEKAYVQRILRYIQFRDHPHRQIAEDAVNRFLTHLAVTERVEL